MISLRRTYLVARRDYLGYVKTWGFWISFFLPFIFGALGVFATTLNINVEPTRYVTILDETGEHKDGIAASYETMHERNVRQALMKVVSLALSKDEKATLEVTFDEKGVEGALVYLDGKIPAIRKRFKVPKSNTILVETPASSIDDLQPYLKGSKLITYNGEQAKLSAAVHIHKDGGKLRADYWSENIRDGSVRGLVSEYFRARATRTYLSSGGLSPEGLNAALKQNVSIKAFDPTKEVSAGSAGQAVTFADRIPYVVATAMALILWLTVFSGSYMLLTSMLEEKLNKLMEMMLASVRFSEIIFGKLIGVAALTITAMMPYILIGVVGSVVAMSSGNPIISDGLSQAFSPKMLVFFPIFLFLGYVFYGAFFIALGALAESMQDAQTLTTPIMLVLTACVMVVPLGLKSPDSPILDFASWFPLSAPFAAIVRLPSDPPWWELALSAAFLAIISIVVIWIAGRIFRFGVLSGAGVKSVKQWFMRAVLRRKA